MFNLKYFQLKVGFTLFKINKFICRFLNNIFKIQIIICLKTKILMKNFWFFFNNSYFEFFINKYFTLFKI